MRSSTDRHLPFFTPADLLRLGDRANEIVEYRKSGLSLNHVQGCSLGCTYCVRLTYALGGEERPRAVCTDAEAVEQLVTHPYFRSGVTPLQIFNRATDPFLAAVRPHTLRVLKDLDARGHRNHTLVITRERVTEEDCDRLNRLANLKVTLLFTRSGIEDKRIEPFPSKVAAESMVRAARLARRYKVVQYWRPLVPGLNDTEEHFQEAATLSNQVHATVFTGLFYRDEIRDYWRSLGIPEPYRETYRRKIVPQKLELRLLAAWRRLGGAGDLFRKTSCAVCYAWGEPDYNGHYGVRELCDICPVLQLGICAEGHRPPAEDEIREFADALPGSPAYEILDVNATRILFRGLKEQQRYALQHHFRFQMWDVDHPHLTGRHGRANLAEETLPDLVEA